MPALSETGSETEDLPLTSIERELILFFVRIAQAFGIPKSTAEIFGLIFSSPEPIAFETIVRRLQLSKSSASTGLRFLQRMNAIVTVPLPLERKTYYQPEMSMRRLITGLLGETALPHLHESSTHLDNLETLLSAQDTVDPRLENRLAHLRNWNRKASRLLPLILRLAGGKP